MARKGNATVEDGVAKMFERKGIIITELKTGSSLDDAETDGIEV